MAIPETSSPRQATFDEAAKRRVRVLLPLPLAGPYDYLAAENLHLRPGDFVEAPLGKRSVIGVVWDDAEDRQSPELTRERLRDVESRLDTPPLATPIRRFVDWVASYTLTPPGAVLRMTMSVSAALEPPRPIFACRATPAAPDPGASGDRKLTAARRRVLRALEGGPPRLPAELAREAGVGGAVVRGMLDLGWLELVGTKRAPPPTPDGGRVGPTL